MVKKLAILSISLLLVACIKPFETPPADVIQEPKMRDILIDIHLQEAFIMQRNLNNDSSTQAYLEAKKQVLAKYKVDTALFRKSQDFYFKHPSNYKRIYEGVVDTLALREQRGLLK